MTEGGSRSEADLLDRIDAVVHAPARLRILMLLHVVEAAEATFLVNQTGLTWGNLSTHLGKLEESGYVEVEKGYRGKRPCTMIRLTEEGRAAFREYRDTLRALLDDMGG